MNGARQTSLLWALGVALALAATSVAATTFPPLGLAALLERADVVVRVQVSSADARWLDGDGQTRIATFHRAEVLEVLVGAPSAGELSDGLWVGTPGGAVGDIGQRVHGARPLTVGGEYVLFLGRGEGPGAARGIIGFDLGTMAKTADGWASANPRLPTSLATLRHSLPEPGQLPAAPTGEAR